MAMPTRFAEMPTSTALSGACGAGAESLARRLAKRTGEQWFVSCDFPQGADGADLARVPSTADTGSGLIHGCIALYAAVEPTILAMAVTKDSGKRKDVGS